MLTFLLEQEKVSRAQAAKDKAYQEAVRSQQNQEEINGFRKLPARAPPQGKQVPCYRAMLTMNKY